MSQVPEHEEDPDEFQPSPDEILEFALYLGMDPENDKELMWIAEEGLKAPVPDPWVTMNNENDDIYYLNPLTSEVMWEHPLDAQGYQSIGCVPCTRRFDSADERSARWFGMNKTECGLHTELIG